MSKKNKRTPVSVVFRAVASKPAKQGVGGKLYASVVGWSVSSAQLSWLSAYNYIHNVYTCTQLKDTLTLIHTECEGIVTLASYRNMCIHLTARTTDTKATCLHNFARIARLKH